MKPRRHCCIGGGSRSAGQGGGDDPSCRCLSVLAVPSSAFKGFRFPPEVIVLAVRWYLRFGLSYRDVEELLAERGIEVDHVTVYRWVQRFTPLFADAARPCRHAVGDRWFVDETYVKVAGRWRYVYRAVDQYGQIIDVYVSAGATSRRRARFFETRSRAHGEPAEVVTDRARRFARSIDELIPAAFHNTEQYANNRIEADHGRLKARLRRCAASNATHTARVIMRGHALMQNIRRGHYELGVEARLSARRGRVHRTRPNHLTGHRPQPRSRGEPSNSTQQSPHVSTKAATRWQFCLCRLPYCGRLRKALRRWRPCASTARSSP